MGGVGRLAKKAVQRRAPRTQRPTAATRDAHPDSGRARRHAQRLRASSPRDLDRLAPPPTTLRGGGGGGEPWSSIKGVGGGGPGVSRSLAHAHSVPRPAHPAVQALPSSTEPSALPGRALRARAPGNRKGAFTHSWVERGDLHTNRRLSLKTSTSASVPEADAPQAAQAAHFEGERFGTKRASERRPNCLAVQNPSRFSF